MDLLQEWNNMNIELAEKDSTPAIASYKFDDQSHSLIGSLSFKLKWKLRWIRIIDLPILIAALFLKGDLQLLLLFVFVTYETCRFFGIKEFKQIKTAVDFDASTRQVLTDNLNVIQRILRMENIFGYIFLPLSAPIGLLAYKLYIHQSIQTVLNLPNLPLQIGLCFLVGIPGIWLAKKMNDSIFAAPIKDLNGKITALSENND